MSNSADFHTQLASIMEVLANAAVAEICKLVDDGYAVLRLEMSQCKKENEDLKRKLHMIEFQIARGQDVGRTRDGAANNRSRGIRMCDKFKGAPSTDAGISPALDTDLGKMFNCTLWRDGEATVVDDGTPFEPFVISDEEEMPDPSHIKKERSEEDEGGVGRSRPLEVCGERAMDPAVDGGKVTALTQQTSPSKGTDELTELHRTRHSIWEVSGLEAVFKAEPEKESVNHRPQRTGSEHRAERLNNLNSEDTVCERPWFTPGSTDTETDEPSCSYAAEMDSEDLSVDPETQPVPQVERDAGQGLCPLGAPDRIRGAVLGDSVFTKREVEVCAKRRPCNEDREVDGSRHKPSGPLCLPQFSVRGRTVVSKTMGPELHFSAFADESTDPRHKGQRRFEMDIVHTGHAAFTCRRCGKRFAHLDHLKAHESTHAEVGRFNCTQCRKGFFCLQELQKHKSIHTREKPFVCTLCAKSFVCSSQLKIHQNVHTGERPFGCTQCGKSFSHPSNLKRHQRHHHRELSEPSGGGPLLLQVKEERFENLGVTDPAGTPRNPAESPESGSECVERMAFLGRKTPAASGLDLVGNGAGGEVSALETVLKAEVEKGGVNPRAQRETAGLKERGSEYLPYQKARQPESDPTRDVAVPEAEGPSCSYAPEDDPEGLSFLSELRVHSGALHASCGPDRGEEAPRESMIDASLPFAQLPVGENPKSSAKGWNRFTSGDESFRASEITRNQQRNGAVEKQLCYTYFEREVEAHQTVNAGERPFTCAQCGKRFTQSCHLKVHKRVHTGEKPFSCAQCGKRFAQSSHIKRHQRVHTGEKPFRCTLCGKQFAHSSNLKVHQSVHTREKGSFSLETRLPAYGL